ncbi:cysteine desulfurase family protein [Nocardioides marmorisolisilvae]|uniref:Aminotransferase class V-fold PLP-dependent enzyme n=1 Tax=Nocardioides marmorisolisilvae TaxID=1542737 RepID=A0A3N0DTU7_9ACTN|nr:aminotransferase class V-fold PLP-dependent enzyme [Nocardioides marmorisolisilvae]RNL79047.1 aminotransferase class V-fold PLP-dependent enzyme [Nocardioides marmorisolisilvae]
MTTYLDSASGEPLHPAARAVLEQALDAGYADPRRLHGPARNARIMLDNARAATAEALGVRPDEVTFTASGTQAVHLGLLGLLAGQARRGRRLLTSAVEHSAVLHAARWHHAQGGSHDELPVDAFGRVSPDTVAQALGRSDERAVVAIQSANHEVGTLQPLGEIAAVSGEHPLFVDAGASAGRLPLPPGWSAAAASAHKWGGPGGVGLLLVRKGARWRHPFVADDVDQFPIEGESVPLALAAAAALQAVVAERDELNRRQFALVDRLRAGVAAIPDTEVVGDPVDRLPHLVTFSFLYVDGESIVGELDRRGFAVASGSACTASTLEPSHVLAAMGALTHGNLRVSLGRDTTEDDVDRLVAALPEVVGKIRQDAGL